jgi:hypothetical protein
VDRVIEVDHMSHLWDSKQIRSNLKLLARKILGTDYKEQADLEELVKTAGSTVGFVGLKH